jgi:ribosome modulation factor
MAALMQLQAERARLAGAMANIACYPRLAPRDLGQFASHWLAGWEQAAAFSGPGRGTTSGAAPRFSCRPAYTR